MKWMVLGKEVAVGALSLAAAKLPLKTKLIIKGRDPWVQ